MLTLIDPSHLKTIVHLSAEAIRDFLSHADANQFKGEAHGAIASFQADPSRFSDDQLVAWGSDWSSAIDHSIRIEVRGITDLGAAQMVAKGIWGPDRVEAAADIAKKCQQLGIGIELKLAGTSSIEFNVKGVDKSVPIRYLQRAFDEVLRSMNYQPGTHIDARQTKTIIAADGDDTIYDGPKLGVLPGLADSPVRDALYAYLRAGGVFMLVSGNDMNRSFKRLLDGLPEDVYCRVLVAANGGAELVLVDAKGQACPVPGYRQQALVLAATASGSLGLDMVYIGDDGSKDGNDYPAFQAVGFKHSVLVARKFLAEYDPALKPSYVGGLLQGTKKFLEDFLSARMGV